MVVIRDNRSIGRGQGRLYLGTLYLELDRWDLNRFLNFQENRERRWNAKILQVDKNYC